LHIDPRFGQADLDVVLPMRRLTELAHEGFVGQAAPRHYSIMGYILEPDVLVNETAPAIAARMRADGAGHVHRAAIRVARVAGQSTQRIERCAAIADRWARHEKAVATAEPLQRPHSTA